VEILLRVQVYEEIMMQQDLQGRLIHQALKLLAAILVAVRHYRELGVAWEGQRDIEY
jgi:hypothetical protein